MAKLYAELTSDKGGRVVGKGGDQSIRMRIMNGNLHMATIQIHEINPNQGTVINVTSHMHSCDIVTHKKKS